MYEITAVTEVLGAFVGVVGVSIAVWLQLVSAKAAPARYVIGFYLFGATFLLTNAGALGVPPHPANILGLLGVLVALAVEVAAAVFVYRRYGNEETTRETVEAMIGDLR